MTTRPTSAALPVTSADEHPTLDRLADLLDARSDVVEHEAARAHVAACAECRGSLAFVRATRDAAAAADVPPLPPALRERVLASRAAGVRALVPAVAPRATRRGGFGGRSASWAVVAAGLVLGAVLLARPVPRAEAGLAGGALTVSPRAPRPGDTLAVVYRPSALLAGAPRLRLRATFHPDDDTRPWGRPAVTAAWLTLGTDGAYHGRVAPPAGTAYARFAVEDSAARVVDAHGREPWDVVLADAAGRPRVPGIRTQSLAAGPGAWERQRQLTLQATRAHPDHPSGWWVRTTQDLDLAGSARADSVAAASRPLVARLDGALERVPNAEPWAMLDLASFAEFAGMPQVRRRWQARLLAERPRSTAAYTLRVQGLWAAKASPAAQLDSLERWWAADGDSLALFVAQSVGLAVTARDTAAARRWATRAVAADPVTTVSVAQQLVRDARLAALAVAYARADIGREAQRAPGAVVAGDAERPLDHTAAAWDRVRARHARMALAVVGRGLLALGRPLEAAAALDTATAAGWDADAFRLLGEARLAAGDTAAALGALAYAAADPRLGRALADSLGTRLGPRARGAAWARAVADARQAMHARVLASTVAEAPRGDPRVADGGGARRHLSALAGGRVAVVALLSSRCGPALADLPAVNQLRAGLAGRPVAFVALTREAPGGSAERDLRARGLTAPLWYDPDGEAGSALDARGTPTYLVLDASGTIRWRGHRVRDASPVLDALLAGAGD